MINAIPWYIPVLLTVLIKDGVTSVFLKKVVVSTGRYERFFLQFFFAWIYATLFWLISGNYGSTTFQLILPIMGIGLLNGIATTFYWRALDISLSKSHFFLFLDDVIAICLSLVILKEFQILNLGLAIGIMMGLSSIISFAIHSMTKSVPVSEKVKIGRASCRERVYVLV